MPTSPTYPGVYIEEVPSPVRAIVGVSTSITAFVGFTPKGPTDTAVRCQSFGDYERAFGGLHRDSEVSYAVQQFFLNGGKDAIVVRVAEGATKADLTLRSIAGKRVLKLTAKSVGGWGNFVKVDVDYDTRNPDALFNLNVTEYVKRGQDLLEGRSESFRNLTLSSRSADYAPKVVTDQSDLLDGTLGDEVLPAALQRGSSMTKDLSTFPALDATKKYVAIMVDGEGPFEIPLWTAAAPANIQELKTSVDAALTASGVPALDAITVETLAADGTSASALNTAPYLRLTSANATDASSVRVFSASRNDVAKTLGFGYVNGGREVDATSHLRPAPSGLASGDLRYFNPTTLAAADKLTLTFADGLTSEDLGPFQLDAPLPTTLQGIATALQAKIRQAGSGNATWEAATVSLVGSRLVIFPGDGTADAKVTASEPAAGLATKLRLLPASASSNATRYSVGTGTGTFQSSTLGAEGQPPTNIDAYRGALASKTGIYALEDVDIFNLLCIPRLFETTDETKHATLLAEALAYCTSKRAFMIADPPKTRGTPPEIAAWMKAATPDKNGALYWPAVHVADPLEDYRLRVVAPSGTIAGLYARIDSARGIWKAPAGTEATLTNVSGLDYALTDTENGILNPIAVNCLRAFPGYGRISWGARTLLGADAQASEWKYVPIRRLALYIEESLYRGTKWVVFEPNDEPLWAQIRLNVGAFMHDLFRKGAFQGRSPKEAYFVKCDAETNPQDEIDRGIVNVLVGFAPLKPAEFVIIKISQIAAQAQT